MITIGITGGIGSGKSYICKVFSQMGIPIYDCDNRAKSLYDKDLGLKREMINLLGKRIYDTPTGTIDKRYLSEIIFSDKEMLKRVNALVHPAVQQDIDYWKREQEAKGYAIVVLESAILLNSSNLMQRIDKCLVVSAPLSTRLKRATERDLCEPEIIQKRINAQLNDSEMCKKADYIIYNDGITHILPQISKFIQTLDSI